MSEMIIKAKDGVKGICGYCHKKDVENISLTFMCFICNEKCDNEYFREYNRACIETEEKYKNDDEDGGIL